jgi:hypothetical protein
MSKKKLKKVKKLHGSSAGCFHFRAEGFSCILDFLYGGLGINK